MANELEAYKCQINYSEGPYLLNTQSDDPADAVQLMVDLKQQLNISQGNGDAKEEKPVEESSEILCPVCDAKMAKKWSNKNNQYFWGCTQYPKCKGTREIEG